MMVYRMQVFVLVVSGACYRLFIDGLSGMMKGAVLGALVRYVPQQSLL